MDRATQPINPVGIDVPGEKPEVIYRLPACQWGRKIYITDESSDRFWDGTVVPVVTTRGFGLEYEVDGAPDIVAASWSLSFADSYRLAELASLRLLSLRVSGDISTADGLSYALVYGVSDDSIVEDALDDLGINGEEGGLDEAVKLFQAIYPSSEDAAGILYGLLGDQTYLSEEVMRKGVRFALWLREEADAGRFMRYDRALAKAVSEVFPFLVDGRLPPRTTTVYRVPLWRSLLPDSLLGAIDRVRG